jgi:mannose-6-phosphate isomerase-like protein (cupin superfamily)
MRTHVLAFTFLTTAIAAAAAASGALAQQPAPAAAPAAAPSTAFMSDKDIMGLVDKAKADRKGDAPVSAEPILRLAPYRAQLEYRPIGGAAAVHEKDAELMVVLQGAGDIVTGGTLVDGKRVNAYNLSGPSIANGESHAVVKGDMIFIPPNTPHQVTPSGGAAIVLMTMHVPYPPTDWQRAN